MKRKEKKQSTSRWTKFMGQCLFFHITWSENVLLAAKVWFEKGVGVGNKLAWLFRKGELCGLWCQSWGRVVISKVAPLSDLSGQNHIVRAIKVLGAHRQRARHEAGLVDEQTSKQLGSVNQVFSPDASISLTKLNWKTCGLIQKRRLPDVPCLHRWTWRQWKPGLR